MRILFSPILKDSSKTRTDPWSLFHKIFTLLIKKEFQTIGDQHEIEYEIFVLGMITSDADHITYIFWILSNQSITNIPIGLSDHIGKEDALDLIH